MRALHVGPRVSDKRGHSGFTGSNWSNG